MGTRGGEVDLPKRRWTEGSEQLVIKIGVSSVFVNIDDTLLKCHSLEHGLVLKQTVDTLQ